METVNDVQRVIVTGGASGIGLSVSAAFLEAGASVGIVSRTRKSIDAALAGPLSAYAERVQTRTADVADDDEMATAMAELGSALGGVDAIVASAGVEGNLGEAIAEVTSQDFRRVLDVNVIGVFHTVKYALPFLTESKCPSITIIGSDSGFVAAPGMLAYNASKGAVVQLTRALSFELFEDHGIRVNSVCPSLVDTPMARRGLGVHDFSDADFPVNSPDEVARTVLFLSAPGSRPINGSNVLLDFGYSARSSFPA